MSSEQLQEIQSAPALVAGDVDLQVATARRFPRSIKAFRDKALAMATLDEGTAGACFYALPRDGKTVEGPSARLAEICASAWGNMRVEGRVVDEDERFVTSRATAWDLETNVAIAFEARRRITNKSGKRYNEDMIATTANAATSIAVRNAVFKVVPSAFWRPIYDAARKVAVGDASTLVDRRAKALAFFQKMGVGIDRILAVLELKGLEDISLDHLATLHGLATAIKDGETTVDEAFPAPHVQPPQRKAEPAVSQPAAWAAKPDAHAPTPAAQADAFVQALDTAAENAAIDAELAEPPSAAMASTASAAFGPTKIHAIKPRALRGPDGKPSIAFAVTADGGRLFDVVRAEIAQALGAAREERRSIVLHLSADGKEITGCSAPSMA